MSFVRRRADAASRPQLREAETRVGSTIAERLAGPADRSALPVVARSVHRVQFPISEQESILNRLVSSSVSAFSKPNTLRSKYASP